MWMFDVSFGQTHANSHGMFDLFNLFAVEDLEIHPKGKPDDSRNFNRCKGEPALQAPRSATVVLPWVLVPQYDVISVNKLSLKLSDL